MADVDRVTAWVQGYRKAWESNDPGDVAALFTEDAEYRTAPYDRPRRGRDEVVKGWLDDRDEPGTTTFSWSLIAMDGDVAVVEGTTIYPDRTYSNLWVLRLAEDGRCGRFTEWYMKHPTAG
jgi:uncharacterized protein (TIGR02246 family)